MAATADKPKDPQNKNAWMMTFADLLSLMLTFFILIFSMSIVENRKWEKVVQSLSSRLSPDKEENLIQYTEDYGVHSKESVKPRDLEYLYTIIQQKLLTADMQEDVQTNLLDDRIILSMTNESLFESDSTALTSRAKQVLYALGDVTGQIANKIEINGHTDPTKPGNPYPSNWELSLARAMVVAEELRKHGNIYEMEAFGLADAHFKDLSKALEKEEHYMLSRRVDIVIRNMVAKSLKR